MNYKIKRSVYVIFTLAVFLSQALIIVGCTASKTVESGSTWTVTEKTEIGKLSIKEGSTVNAPDGYLLTMTVNGVETQVKAGEYQGQIVIAPTKKIGKALYNGRMTKGENVDYRPALFVDGGQVVEESSALSALVGGSYDGKSASGMTITSNNSRFNGIIINDSDYTMSNVKMTANSPGGNDFTGWGAGLLITGASKAVVDNFNFTGVGLVRNGISILGSLEKDNLNVTIKNSFFKSDGSVGEIIAGSGMSSPPWVLGVEPYGHVRTQLVAGYATVNYEKCTFLSDGWGVLSTDDVSVPAKYGDYAVKINVKDSIVDITGTSGYGSFSIGACYNIFDNTVMGQTQYSSGKYGLTYGMIVFNEYAGGEFINGSNVTARYGVMYEYNQTGVTKVDGSTFNTYGPTFLIKSCYPVINVSKSKLNSENGVIVQLMDTDDSGMMAKGYVEGLKTVAAAKDKKHDLFHVNKTNTKIFNEELKDVVSDAQATFSDMEIKGDFYNSIGSKGETGQNLILGFDKVNLTGVVSSTTAVHKNFSYYFSSEKDKDGNKIAVNADGLQIDGKWEAEQSMFGGGGMPGGAAGGAGAPGGAGPDGAAPGGEGPGGAAPGGAFPGASGDPGADAGGRGAMPMDASAGRGEMPSFSEGFMSLGGAPGAQPSGGASKSFTAATDANGNYVVVGEKKYDLNEGVIVSKNATYLGDLINTPAPAVNNGVIVTLTNGTVWTVTGTSYLTGLTIDNGAIAAPEGGRVEMTVNGARTEIKTGKTYTGNIVLSVVKGVK